MSTPAVVGVSLCPGGEQAAGIAATRQGRQRPILGGQPRDQQKVGGTSRCHSRVGSAPTLDAAGRLSFSRGKAHGAPDDAGAPAGLRVRRRLSGGWARWRRTTRQWATRLPRARREGGDDPRPPACTVAAWPPGGTNPLAVPVSAAAAAPAAPESPCPGLCASDSIRSAAGPLPPALPEPVTSHPTPIWKDTPGSPGARQERRQ